MRAKDENPAAEVMDILKRVDAKLVRAVASASDARATDRMRPSSSLLQGVPMQAKVKTAANEVLLGATAVFQFRGYETCPDGTSPMRARDTYTRPRATIAPIAFSIAEGVGHGFTLIRSEYVSECLS